MSENIVVNIETVSEDQLPAIIREQVDVLSEYRKKKDEAKRKASEAKLLADQMEGVKRFKTKSAVEDLQEAQKVLSDAQILASEAQEKSYEYQKKLATASRYLFALGAKNMAMNRSVVRELRATLEGADPEDLDDLAQKEFDDVIAQLLAQEDLMAKQNKMADTIDILDVELAGHRDQIIRNAESIKKHEIIVDGHDKLIKEGIEKDKEHDRLLAEKKVIDSEQDKELKEQSQKDSEHDESIEELWNRVEDLSTRVSDAVPMGTYKRNMIVLGCISIVATIISVIGLMT